MSLSLPCVAQQASQTVRVATRVLPPMVVQQDGRLTGFSIELWDRIAARLKLETRYVPGIFHAAFWAITTLAAQGDGTPRQWLARGVSVLWKFTAVAFVAFRTAQLTAALTVRQIQGTINGPQDLAGSGAVVAGHGSGAIDPYMSPLEIREGATAMLDAKRLLDQVLGGQAAGSGKGSSIGGFGTGAIAGGLAAILLGTKTGRKLGGSALKLGGIAAVGALAYKAYQDWQAGKAATGAPSHPAADVPALPPPTGTPFNPADEAAQQSLARSLLRAMIAAAKADGHVDAQEQARVFAQIDRLGLGAEDKAFVIDELRAKLDIDAVAAGAATPEQAAEIYAASLLAIDPDNAAERGYLAMLAARLGLDDGLVAHLHRNVAAASPPTPS